MTKFPKPNTLAIACPLLLFGLLLSACEPAERDPVDVDSHEVLGQVVEIRYEGEAVLIDHEEIPDVMTAMRMEFRVRDRDELANVQPGDSIRFRFVVSPPDSYIEDIEVLSRHPASLNAADEEETETEY